MKTTLDTALIVWSATCASRAQFASGYTAVLGPFLSGWFARDMGVRCLDGETLGTFTSSWRAGWAACDGHLRILAREEPHPFRGASEKECETCGLHAGDRVHRPAAPMPPNG